MSAVVIGTYLCALYGARSTTVSAKTLLPRPAARVATTRAAVTTERPIVVVAVETAQR